jgi:glycosyltransferase involved in cell wall biosynthesis
MVTFVVAAYNEEKSIEKTVRNIFDNGYDSVIVVNDGSRDATGDILDNLVDEYL